ncbi:3-oxoacyl-[acyl-carrier-protein] synthase III C-terminal domain-containing protein, partial [Streptomyces decoyicus]
HDADVRLGDVARFVVPHFGRIVLQREVLAALDIDLDLTTWSWGRTVGHLGAGDQFAGLDHLVTSGRAVPGDRVVLIGVGAGYSWGAAVVEICDRPAWARV